MPHIGAAGMMGFPPNHVERFGQQQHGGYIARKSCGGLHGIPDTGRASGASSPDTEFHHKFYPQQHQQYQGFRSDTYSGMIPQEPRRESVLVIRDGGRMGASRGPMYNRVPVPTTSVVAEESDEEAPAFFDGNMDNTRRVKQMHQHVSDNDDADESELDDEERRRYVKRQRHRSLIDADGVHEIRFDNPSTEASSSSESNSPKSGGEHDDVDEIIMIDAGEGDDSGSRRNLMDMEREGDAARVLEEMKMYTAGLKKYATNGIKGGSTIRRVSSRDKYLQVLNHKAPIPVAGTLSPRPPNSPRVGGAKSVISRVSTPFQRMASPFVRATSGEGNHVSGYLEILETIPQSGAQPNMNAFAKITDWLLILTNGISRHLQLHVVRQPMAAPPDSVRNLTILYHPQPPPGGSGSINLGTIPTINAVDPHGRSPLHIAIRHRLPLEIVKLLINLGGDISSKDDQEVNCLHEALQLSPPATTINAPGGRTEWTKSYLLPLIEVLLDSYATSHPSNTEANEEDSVVQLVNEPMAWSSDSPLHLALKHNQDISIVQLLVERGAVVEGVLDVFGASPLHIVCQNLANNLNEIPRKAAIVDLLLQNGAAAEINSKTADGHTPLHYAVKALYASPTGGSSAGTPPTTTAINPYATASFKDSCNVVEMLIGKGNADVSIRNNDGYAPVELASLALAGRVEADCSASNTHGSAGAVEAMMLLGNIVKLLVKTDRERYLQKEDEMGGR
ncbi:ankyrin repeat-containing domain protein [Tirmania nivea]|nr:ankyrin repeat-containing domain protein [Tirmania nivea]